MLSDPTIPLPSPVKWCGDLWPLPPHPDGGREEWGGTPGSAGVSGAESAPLPCGHQSPRRTGVG